MRVARMRGMITLGGLLAACGGGGDLLLPGAGEPASVTVLQGNEQNGRVGEPLPQPLVVSVSDATGRPVQGATVVFVLTDAAPGASLAPDTTTTDAGGNAAAQVVLGTRPGAQTGEVHAIGAAGTPTATTTFTLTALPESADGITAVTGDGQSAPVGSALPQPLVVEVADAFGNPIPDVAVTWTAEGGGSVSAPTTTTGGDGRTSVQRTLGPAAGSQSTLATVDGLAGSPVTFVHTATAGSAAGVTIVSGNGQTGPVATELPGAIVVRVRDAASNPVPGVAVAWVIGAGGGSVTPSTSNTDASGQASATWTLGASPGPNTLSAVVSGIGVAEFSASATGGAPARLSLATPPAATATSGVPLGQQPVIQLLDAAGNQARQAGVEVRVTIASGGGTLGGTASRPTDGNGQAVFTDLLISGAPGDRTLRFQADGFAAVTSGSVSLAAAATVTTIVSHTPDPSRVGDEVTVAFTVTSAAGTPTGTVRVHDGDDACTSPLSAGQGSCTLALRTAGSRTLTADYAGADGFAASSATAAHTVEAAPAPVLAIVTQPPPQATLGAVLDPAPVVQLRTGDGAELHVADVPVTVTIASGGGTLSGTMTRSTDGDGRVQFGDLAISGDPGPRTLLFAAEGYGGATSDSTDVQPAPGP
jgi:Big-like domain-containing protein